MKLKKGPIKKLTAFAVVCALSWLFLLFCFNTAIPALAQDDEGPPIVLTAPDLVITAIKPYHYEWSDEYNLPKGEPWFNVENYVEVTVRNDGTVDAESFAVNLYADDELIGSKTVDALPPDEDTDVTFRWEPEGDDPLSWIDTEEGAVCSYEDTSVEYPLRAVIDEGNEILEEDEENNDFEIDEPKQVVWNGYIADEPLETAIHGEVEGAIIYTTGDGEYRSYLSGHSGTDDTYYDITYDLAFSGSTELARLYMYYTWAKPSYKAPKIAVMLETPSGDSYNLEMEKSYSDIKGDFGVDRYAWGTYTYDITDYVQESGTYLVSVKNLNYGGGDSDFSDEYSFAPPGILVVYEDKEEPIREYWVAEGADLLMGGEDERPYGGFLSLEECENTATFHDDIDLSEVEEAVLGVVSVWGGNPSSGWNSYVYFNDEELGMDVYEGYSGSYSEEMGGLSMSIGSDDAQIGIALTEVTNDLEDDDNEVIQGDDGDNMMPANAILVITYEDEGDDEYVDEDVDTHTTPGITTWTPAEAQVSNVEGESRTFSIAVNQTVDISWQINGTEVRIDESVTEASYTNTSAIAGTWNVSVIATNKETDLSTRHIWIWNVSAALTGTPTPAAVNITATASPAPSVSTPTPSSAAKPTATPPSTPTHPSKPTTEEDHKPKTDEVPTPGFELVVSLFMLLTVAYLLKKS